MLVAFRADSGFVLGGGHLTRCLVLADELRGRGVGVVFVSRELPGHAIQRLEAAGHETIRLPGPSTEGVREVWDSARQASDAEDTTRAISGRRVDWMVVDHYGLDARWERSLTEHVGAIAAVDDLADRDHACDCIIDQGYQGGSGDRYATRAPAARRRLLGPRYAMLHPDYPRLRATTDRTRGRLERTLVSFGSTDPTNETGKVVEALVDVAAESLAIDIVVSRQHPRAGEIAAQVRRHEGAEMHHDLPSLAPLMARADFGIGAGGVSTWERACLGLPSLAAVTASNQLPATMAMARDGFQLVVAGGRPPGMDDWREAIASAMRDPQALSAMGQRAATLTDGLGVKRVARALLGRENLSVQLRNAAPDDESLLLHWANEEAVRAHSFRRDRIEPDEHARWFRARLADRDTVILVGEDEAGLPVGQVRFDIDRARQEATIDISVDASARGAGVGIDLLSAAVTRMRDSMPDLRLVAEVRNENERSRRLFARCGFTQVAGRRPDAVAFQLG